jgi:hypothetical protein
VVKKKSQCIFTPVFGHNAVDQHKFMRTIFSHFFVNAVCRSHSSRIINKVKTNLCIVVKKKSQIICLLGTQVHELIPKAGQT